MLSVIFYGRNDNHGYNLHKRASLSLNNIAELLTHPDDEILFVDWNTPPGLPTFIESIHDLLTDKAKNLIKIIKVDFSIHEKLFAHKTKKATVEPVARNAAIVRSNPNNRWILSTNTDMIFIPKDPSKSLSDICQNLEAGFYELPRFSLPEIIWETFDRLDPKATIDSLKDLRTKIDLDEVISAGPILLYDAPGDFQLFLRSDILKIRGFDEEMLLGWHVDSNLCRRLNLHRGETKSLIDSLLGYHCEHTKILTHFTTSSLQNSLKTYFDLVKEVTANIESDSWGLSNLDLEPFKVKDVINNRQHLLIETNNFIHKDQQNIYANSMGELATYRVSHTLPYVIDALYQIPRSTKVLYFGECDSHFRIYSETLHKFYGVKLLHYSNLNSNLNWDKENFAIILDLGFEPRSAVDLTKNHFDLDYKYYPKMQKILESFLDLVILNKSKNIYKILIVTINAETYDNGVGQFLNKVINLPKVAANSRVRAGYLKNTIRNRSNTTLTRLKNNIIKNVLYANDPKDLNINSEFYKRSKLNLRSHSIPSYLSSFEGFTITRRGFMFNDSQGNLNFDVSHLTKNSSLIVCFEIDRPYLDTNIQEIEMLIKINDSNGLLKFKSGSSQSARIFSILPVNHNVSKFNYEIINNSNFPPRPLRMTNITVASQTLLSKSLILINLSNPLAGFFIKDNWSYGNEGEKRWTTNSNFSLDLSLVCSKTASPRLLMIETKFFKNMSDSTFIKNITIGENKLKFLEFPRLSRRRGRILVVFLKRFMFEKDQIIKFECRQNEFDPYFLHRNEPRVLHSSHGLFGVARSIRGIMLLVFLFPFAIALNPVWVKLKVIYHKLQRNFF